MDDFTLQDLREGIVHYVDDGDEDGKRTSSALGLRIAVRQGGEVRQGNVVTIPVETFSLQVYEVRYNKTRVRLEVDNALTSGAITANAHFFERTTSVSVVKKW